VAPNKLLARGRRGMEEEKKRLDVAVGEGAAN